MRAVCAPMGIEPRINFTMLTVDRNFEVISFFRCFEVLFSFLSSAYVVSPGPTSHFLLSCGLFVTFQLHRKIMLRLNRHNCLSIVNYAAAYLSHFNDIFINNVAA